MKITSFQKLKTTEGNAFYHGQVLSPQHCYEFSMTADGEIFGIFRLAGEFADGRTFWLCVDQRKVPSGLTRAVRAKAGIPMRKKGRAA